MKGLHSKATKQKMSDSIRDKIRTTIKFKWKTDQVYVNNHKKANELSKIKKLQKIPKCVLTEYKHGKSLSEIIKKYHLSNKYLKIFLMFNKVEIRPPSFYDDLIWNRQGNKKRRKELAQRAKGNRYAIGSNPDKTSRLHTEIMKKKWKDLDYRNKQLRSILSNNSKKYNKSEQKLDIFLQKLLPNEYKYVGDGQFFLGSKNPDFLNMNNKKKIIELFGDYWHKNDKPEDRINYFKQHEYDCLVVWDSELNDIEKLKTKILSF